MSGFKIKLADIQQVFTNLMNDSYNQLSVFVSTFITQIEETYQPHYLSTQAYETIINASMQTGGDGNDGGIRQGGYHGGRP